MKQFLIWCRYEHWCQGWEKGEDYFLVAGKNFEHAKGKLQEWFKIQVGKRNPEHFENHTVL